jgi:hypothetical protein
MSHPFKVGDTIRVVDTKSRYAGYIGVINALSSTPIPMADVAGIQPHRTVLFFTYRLEHINPITVTTVRKRRGNEIKTEPQI